MNTYSVYWIKEEIANHYFHKSDILYRFLRSYQNNKTREDLLLQYNYITRTLSYEKLTKHMKEYYISTNARLHINGSHISICKNGSCISLLLYEKHIEFWCDTLQDAEDLLFPMLRKFHRLLFIIGKSDFGWISPVLYTKQDVNLLLYSNS